MKRLLLCILSICSLAILNPSQAIACSPPLEISEQDCSSLLNDFYRSAKDVTLFSWFSGANLYQFCVAKGKIPQTTACRLADLSIQSDFKNNTISEETGHSCGNHNHTLFSDLTAEAISSCLVAVETECPGDSQISALQAENAALTASLKKSDKKLKRLRRQCR